jgi:uncharacterized YceG family protein
VSDDSGRNYPGGDPFVDPADPDSVERAERRREREERRAQKASKQKKSAPPPPPAKEVPPSRPRTPEQEFWDEPAEPPTPPPGQTTGDQPQASPAAADPPERGRRGLLRRRKGKPAGAGAAAGAAAGASAEDVVAAPPTGEAPVPEAPPPPTSEPAQPKSPPPPTGEAPAVGESGPPTTEKPASSAASASSTREEPVPSPAGPATTESSLPEPVPPQTEAPHQPTAKAPRPDPGPRTAESPRPDPNQPTARNAVAGEGATGERRVPPPRPLEQTGAGDWEPPPPRDDLFDDDDHDFHDEGDPRMAGAARHGRRHGDGGARRGGIVGSLFRHPFRILGVIVLILVLIFLNGFFQPFKGDGSGHVVVKIPKGSSVGEVGDLLEKEGVISGGPLFISGSTIFQARVSLAGKRSDLYAGKFVMAKDMSYGAAIDELSKEPEVVKPGVVTVTIPEGYTRAQASQLVKEDGLRGNYIKATKKSKFLNPAKYGGKGAKNLEGFLFPDTWELKSHSPVTNLVQLQLEDFKKKIKHVNMKYAKSKNLTTYDVLTIASIIEHEAGVGSQRKLVAAVIYNRLHEGMTLGSDATVRYATGNFTKPLTESELESESPYNTRNHVGLPPGPISNPGLAAINAAAHPAKADYLFFVTSPDCKKLAFSKTEAEFEKDVQKYEASKCTE